MDFSIDTRVSLYVVSLLIPIYPLLGVIINCQQVRGGAGRGEGPHHKTQLCVLVSKVLVATTRCILGRLLSFLLWVGFSKWPECIVR